MAANTLRLTSLKLLNRHNICSTYIVRKSRYCTINVKNEEPGEEKSRFADFDKKQTELIKQGETPVVPPVEPEPPQSFVSLLRNSKFIAMGNPVGKAVVGEIYHVVGKDLYIDFGWKFPTVCTAPERNAHLYVVGAKVKLLIKDLELSTRFLGDTEYISLNEADCVLLGLLRKAKPKVPQP